MPFNIEFDYRFDSKGFFNDPARRQALEAAGNIWESYIQDEFPDVGAGIQLNAINPETDQPVPVTLPSGIDDLLIFVGSEDLTGSTLGEGGSSSGAAGTIFEKRYFGSNFEPHVGHIVFDTNSPDGSPRLWFFDPTPTTGNDIPPGQSDFISIALHEIGHVLGVGQAEIFDTLGNGAKFNGLNALSVNGGQPIPLESDLAHIKEGFLSDNQPVLMDPSGTPGRTLPTPADLAVLADIGYQIPGYQAQGSTPPIATEGADQIFGTVLADMINGLDGNDQIQGDLGNDMILGLTGDDNIFGQQDNDALFGNRGNDQILGELGDDVIYGGRDDDNLFGEEGNDYLSGDRGNDQLRGGAGRDTFVFRAESSTDVISDFVVTEDFIQVAGGLGFNSGADLLGAIATPIPVTGGGLLSEITLSAGNTIRVFSDVALTAANFTIAGPTTL
ncbi:hypothetical protein [Argonema antarcticum]|uniref:hypothetical protein n=1 Tax=Argonema antarcticum TaxID=2942763 RepID=UPI00201362C6|nr:hypothetical protein [Argonema antarcticum]MCL1471935.1 hypothetical protein [Argonema antarcticum A004/B2]